MKKLGFGKKKGGSSDYAPSSNPSNPYADNPYAANAPTNDPYLGNNASPPPPYTGGGGSNGFRQEKTPVPQGGYGNTNYNAAPPNRGGYGGGPPQTTAERYGTPPAPRGGYSGGPPQTNADRYGGGPPQTNADRYGTPPAPRGGYGEGPPQTNADRYGGGSPQTNADRYGAPPAPRGGQQYSAGGQYGAGAYGQDKFEKAPPQQTPPQQAPRYGANGYRGTGADTGASSAPKPSPYAGYTYGGGSDSGLNAPGPAAIGESGRSGSYGASNGGYGASNAGYGASRGGYGAFEDRQLTAEEQEEQEVDGLKQEIRQTKVDTRDTLGRIVAMGHRTNEIGDKTLQQINQQGESIYNTEKNLDLASNQNRLATANARELTTLNRSMFAMHLANPFTSKQRIKDREEKVMNDTAREREEREKIRLAQYGAQAKTEAYNKDIRNAQSKPVQKQTLVDRAKFQFEAGSDDEGLEDEIGELEEEAVNVVKVLNIKARALGESLETQNKHLDRIGQTVDRVDDEIALNRSRLDRIK